MSLNITQQLGDMYDAFGEITTDVKMRSVGMSDSDKHVTVMLLDAANTRMAEVRAMLYMASGNGLGARVPACIEPLQAEIDKTFENVLVHVTDHAFRGSLDEMDALHADLQRCLDAARIASLAMLAHLTAAALRVAPPSKPHLVAVDGNSTRN